MVFLLFVFLLLKIQIIDNDKYVFLFNLGNQKTQMIKASRGEIVDRNGVVIASNKSSFDIVFNKLYVDKECEYKTILSVVNLLNKYQISVIDDLPLVSSNDVVAIDKNQKSEVDQLKKFFELEQVGLDNDMLSNEIWKKLLKKYKLQSYSTKEARIIAGIKYSMDIKGYSYTVPYVVARDVPMDLIIKLKESGQRVDGIEVVETSSREYLLGDCAPHIIGNVGPIYAEEYQKLKHQNYEINDIIGKNGIEKYCERYLRGADGEKVVDLTNDARDDINGEEMNNESKPTPGNTVVLTIDSELQYIAQQAIERQIKNLNDSAPAGKGKEADAGAVVALDVKTGDVLAIATYPSYDANQYNKNFSDLINDENKPLFNRALLGMYAAGSCYKPVVAIAGLAEKIVDKNSQIYCGHVYNFFAGYKPKCLGHHGRINVMDALKVSCNIYFYELGRLLGIDRINYYGRQLGFGERTGIELAENVGQLASPELREKLGGKWYPGDVLQAAIGQSDNLMSPLQLANYAATIANRGKRMKVNLIKKIVSYDKKNIVYQSKPVVACDVGISDMVFETVIEGMTRASRVGTARRYFGNYPITVPSKTGTPETADLCNSVFVCFAPDKESQIAIAVVIEKGWHGYTGAPVAKEILDKYFGYSNL